MLDNGYTNIGIQRPSGSYFQSDLKLETEVETNPLKSGKIKAVIQEHTSCSGNTEAGHLKLSVQQKGNSGST